VREIRTHGSMSGSVETEHGMRLLRHERGNPDTELCRSLPHRATSRLYRLSATRLGGIFTATCHQLGPPKVAGTLHRPIRVRGELTCRGENENVRDVVATVLTGFMPAAERCSPSYLSPAPR